MMLINSDVVSILLRTSWLVTLPDLGIISTFSMLLYNHNSKDWSVDIVSSLYVNVSTVYRRTAHSVEGASSSFPG